MKEYILPSFVIFLYACTLPRAPVSSDLDKFYECSDGRFVKLPEECFINKCATDSDCVPADCCHSKSCVPLAQKPSCEDVVCTMECMPGTLDCGGSCACQDGKCIGRNYYTE